MEGGERVKVYCVTSDKYRHLVAGFAERFNRFWDNQDVTVLGYDPPEEELPNNFSFLSLGKQEDFGSSWTDGLRGFFMFAQDKHFLLMLEDYWLNTPVSSLQIEYLALKFRDPQVVKVELTDDNGRLPLSGEYEKGLAIRAQDSKYRSSLQASIWRREYFLDLLKPDWSAWDFELRGEKILTNDGKMILVCKPAIMSYDNVMLKGKKK